MNRFFKKSQSTVEYAMLVGIVVAALLGMTIYFRNSIAGKWRESADVFGHGRLYSSSEGTEEPPEDMVTITVEIHNASSVLVWSGNITIINDTGSCYSGYPSIYCWIAWANMGARVYTDCDHFCSYWGACIPSGTPVGTYGIRWKYQSGSTWYYFQLAITGC